MYVDLKLLKCFVSSWKPDLSRRTKDQSRCLYRSHQLIGELVFDLAKDLVECGYMMVVLLIVTLLFCLIKFHSVLHPLVLFCMLFFVATVIILLKVLLSMAVHLREFSEGFYTSFERFDLTHSRADIRFWKSCRPIKLKMGNFGYVETKNFLLILFGPVILDSLCSLVLTF